MVSYSTASAAVSGTRPEPTSYSSRICEAHGCTRSLLGMRPQAKFCSTECRLSSHKDQKRSAARSRTASRAGEQGYFEAADATRGYRWDWQPQTKTKIMLAQVQNILEEYRDHLPLTCRQVYYRLIAEFGHEKGKRLESAVYNLLRDARRAMEIPFDHIRDDGILGGGSWARSADDTLGVWDAWAHGHERDGQDGQPVRLEVWSEAAGMQPQLAAVAGKYSVPVYSSGGFNSLTAIRSIAERCIRDTDGPSVVLHLGDCDPSGYSIFQAVTEDVTAFVEEDRFYAQQTFSAERVAITLEQVEQFKLPRDEIKTKDSRSDSWREQGLTHKTELEALSPAQIATLLTAAIERHLDLDLIEKIRAEQEVEREALLVGAKAGRRVVETLLYDSEGR